MTWIFVAAGIGTAGLAVLAVLTLRVAAAARDLGRELHRARLRLEGGSAGRTGGAHPDRVGRG